MVKPGVVNARTSCSEHADFREIFPVSGRFLYFKNPFKYAGGFNLNHKTVHPAASAPRGDHIFLRHINGLLGH
jgi:hypothetical protein